MLATDHGSRTECRAILLDERQCEIWLTTDSHPIQTLLETAFAHKSLVMVAYMESITFPKRIEQIKLVRDEP